MGHSRHWVNASAGGRDTIGTPCYRQQPGTSASTIASMPVSISNNRSVGEFFGYGRGLRRADGRAGDQAKTKRDFVLCVL